MKQKIQFALFSIIICLIASIAKLSAQPFPCWDAAPASYSPSGDGPPSFTDNNNIYDSIVGSGEYFYAISAEYGTVWQWCKCTGWKEIGGADGLLAIAIHDHYLYIGGDFDEVYTNNDTTVGVAANNIARFNLISRTWESLGYSVPDINSENGYLQIWSIAADAFGNVYAGTRSGTNAIMKWDGTNWTSVGGGLVPIPFVCGSGNEGDMGINLATDGTNIFAAGLFSGAYNGTTSVTSHCIIKWDGINWSAMDGLYVCYYTNNYGNCSCYPDTSDEPDVYIYSIVASGTNVFVTGNFNKSGSLPAIGLAHFSATTGQALPCSCLYPGPYSGQGPDLTEQNGVVYVTGKFDHVDDLSANGIAAWNSTDNTWSTLGSGLRNNSSPGEGYCLAANDNAILVAGSFNYAGDCQISNNIARWMTAPDSVCPSCSPPDLIHPGISIGAFSFNIDGVPNTSWIVYSSTDLKNWNSWGTIKLNDPWGAGTFTDSDISSVSYRFYKLSNGGCCSKAIGFERVTLVPNKTLLANQLDYDGTGINNNVYTVFGTNLPASTTILAWNPATQTFYSCQWSYSSKHGWGYNGGINNINAALNPGGAVFVDNPSGSNASVTLVGHVLQGTIDIPLTPGLEVTVSDPVPLSGGLQTDLGYQPNTNNINNMDSVFLWNPVARSFIEYTYLHSNRHGWNWTPSDPQISVGQGFFLTPGQTTSWQVNYNVCP